MAGEIAAASRSGSGSAWQLIRTVSSLRLLLLAVFSVIGCAAIDQSSSSGIDISSGRNPA